MKSHLLLFYILFPFLLIVFLIIVVKNSNDTHTVNVAKTHINSLTSVRDVPIKKALLCGMIRDDAKNVPKIKKIANEILQHFSSDSKILILENDSVDGTRNELLKWSKNDPRVTVIGCGKNEPICTLNTMQTKKHDASNGRISKMAMLRNEILNQALSSEHNDVDYVIMFDFDVVDATIIGLQNIVFEFEADSTINAQCVLALQGMLMTDPYAYLDLNEDEYMPRFRRKIYGKNKRYEDRLGTGLIKVKSCFNALTIYRRSALVDVYNAGGYCTHTDDSGKEVVCEHICLHSKMSDIYMNTDALLIVHSFLGNLYSCLLEY